MATEDVLLTLSLLLSAALATALPAPAAAAWSTCRWSRWELS